jgi:hypothetical protein
MDYDRIVECKNCKVEVESNRAFLPCPKCGGIMAVKYWVRTPYEIALHAQRKREHAERMIRHMETAAEEAVANERPARSKPKLVVSHDKPKHK